MRLPYYIASKSHAWGDAGETLEDASADFALSELARRGRYVVVVRVVCSGHGKNYDRPWFSPQLV